MESHLKKTKQKPTNQKVNDRGKLVRTGGGDIIREKGLGQEGERPLISTPMFLSEYLTTKFPLPQFCNCYKEYNMGISLVLDVFEFRTFCSTFCAELIFKTAIFTNKKRL